MGNEKTNVEKVEGMNDDGSFKINKYGLWFYPSYYGKKRYEAWLKITPQKLRKLYLEGKTYREIGKIYGVNKSEVVRLYRVMGIPKKMRRKPVIKKDIPEQWFTGNSSVGYVLGAFMGDGCLAGEGEIRLKVTDVDFKDRFIEAILDCGIRRKEIKQFFVEARGKWKPQYGVSIYNKALADYIFNNPTFILKLSDEAKVEFLNGFIDAEGCVSKDNSVTISNTDKWLIDIADEILSENNIKHTIRLEKRYGNRRDCYDIYIRSKSLERFHKIFRFSIKRKQDRFDNAIKERKERKKQHEIEKQQRAIQRKKEQAEKQIKHHISLSEKEAGDMEIITKKFIRCPHCSKLIPIRGRGMSEEARRKIATGVKKAWKTKRKDKEKAGG